MSGAPEADRSSRRAVLTVALTGAALTVAGCGARGIRAHVQKVGVVPASDIPILNQLRALELRAIAAYTAGIPLLLAPAHDAGKQFLQQELAHAGELAGLVNEAHGEPTQLAASYALGHPRTSAEMLALLHELGRAQLDAYLTAIPQLSPGPVRAAVASLLANDAQHVAVLRELLGQQPVPAAFVSGAE